MRESMYYTTMSDRSVKCFLCPHLCDIQVGKCGICRYRENIDGKLFSKNYGLLSAMALDPIEKKPLKRYKPGTHILSVGTAGCNFKCGFCQNYHIAHENPQLNHMSPEKLLTASDSLDDSIGIAFTYNEPTIWYEYVYDVAKENKKDTVLVTNGFINKDPLKELLPHVQAMNIDLKSMSHDFYKKICKGDIEAVKNTIATAHEATHIELTFLAIPDINDTEDEMKKMAEWIAGINEDIPLHIIPFRPMYKMTDIPYQTQEKILSLKNIAEKKLKYVF